ncbi:hypothetical protein Tco_0011292 [Tanacetum coccineum]
MKEPLSGGVKESNIRRIQVKDNVKEVKDYLKTYSSAGMDISWISLWLLRVREQIVMYTSVACDGLIGVGVCYGFSVKAGEWGARGGEMTGVGGEGWRGEWSFRGVCLVSLYVGLVSVGVSSNYRSNGWHRSSLTTDL